MDLIIHDKFQNLLICSCIGLLPQRRCLLKAFGRLAGSTSRVYEILFVFICHGEALMLLVGWQLKKFSEQFHRRCWSEEDNRENIDI